MNHNLKSIRIKRGIREDLPTRLPSGEPAFCVDTKELYIGMGEDHDPVPVSGTDLDLGDVDIEINGENIKLTDLLNHHSDKIRGLEYQVGDLYSKLNSVINSYNSLVSSIGRPNGIAPLGSDAIVPGNHLPTQMREEVIYQSATVPTSSLVFQLSNINLARYRRITISHYAPHSCTSRFYINNKFVSQINTTSRVQFVIVDGVVTGHNINGSVTVDRYTNSTFKWQYDSGCAEPVYYDMRIVGEIY